MTVEPAPIRPLAHDRAMAILLDGVPLIRQHYRADSCIASTRIALDVLQSLGVPARPVVVEATAGNLAWWDAMRAGKVRRQDWPAEAWAVGLGIVNPGTDWTMHLVVVTDHALLDLTLDQASRPARGIPLAPTVFPLGAQDRRTLMEGRRFVAFRDDERGVVVTYRTRVGSRAPGASGRAGPPPRGPVRTSLAQALKPWVPDGEWDAALAANTGASDGVRRFVAKFD